MQALVQRILLGTISIFFFCCYSPLLAQIEVEPALSTPLTPESLINEVFAGKGIDIINVKFSGQKEAVGYFKNGNVDVGMSEGFMMTTGRALLASQPNTNSGEGHTNGSMASDPTLSSIVNDGGIEDAAVYEIEFIPKNDTVEFKYVFASEEYPEFGCNCFNDVFGFFLSGPGYPDWTNLAIVPGTANDPVSVKTIHPLDPDGSGTGVNSCTANSTLPDCNPVNEHLFRDNMGSLTLTYDGLTTVLTARAFVQQCQTYSIKLAIADVGDDLYDSAIFFEANSFGSDAIEVDLFTESIDGALVEGCAGGSITFNINQPAEQDQRINLNFLGNALRGTDFDIAPLTDVIPAGETSLTLNIRALSDEIIEPLDSIGFEVELNDCDTETFWVYIKDSELDGLELGDDTSVCPGDSVSFNGELGLILPQEMSFASSAGNLDINTVDDNGTGPATEATISTITISGVQPTDIREGFIKEVCVQIAHSNMEDIDLVLQSPSGDLLELSTDNGGSGNNFEMTCFTPDAMTPISGGTAPFTGAFAPEGEWKELYGGEANGDWKLYVKDDLKGDDGFLINWSIAFNPLYDLTYQWTPTDGLSCADCPSPKAAPANETEYELQITDSYGCIIRDSITVKTNNDTIDIIINCIDETQNSITIGWNPTADVLYEVNIDGMGWETPSGTGAHTVSGLSEGQTVAFEVRGMGDCLNQKGAVECTTGVCFPPQVSISRVLDQSCYNKEDGQITLQTDNTDVVYIMGTDTTSSNVFSNLKADRYSITALDTTTTCFITLDTIINSPDSIILDTFKTIASCGANDGIAAITPSGGTMPYSILWNTGAGTDTIKNLNPGTYTVELTDDFGCEASQAITIESDDSAVPMDLVISCAEVTSSSITFSWAPVPGVSLYEVKVGDEDWSEPAAIASVRLGDLSVLETVAIQVRGTTDCITVSGSTSCTTEDCMSPQGTFDIVLEGSCADYSNGLITISTPMPNVVYILNNDTSTTGVYEDLTAGDYQFILLDTTTQCSSILDTSLAVRTPLVVETAAQSENCGQQDGRASVMVSGGIAPYQITWSTGAEGASIENLATETYFATITDAIGCSREERILVNLTIGDQENLRLFVDCPVVTNNSILFTWEEIPDIDEYEININDDGWRTASSNFRHEIRDLGFSEIFNFQVRGISDCGGAVIGNQICATTSCIPPTVTIGTVKDVSCAGGSDGELDIVVNTFEFSFTDTIPFCVKDSAGINVIDFDCFQVAELISPIGGLVILGTDTMEATAANPMVTFDNLPAGTYTLQLMDTLLTCRSTINYNIFEPDSLKLETNFEGPISCPDSEDGVLAVTGIGGTEPYSYDWNNGLFEEEVFSNLGPGDYSVVITDINGCSYSESYTVQPAALVIEDIFQQNIGCGEAETGALGIATNDSINYSITWDNGATEDTIFNLPQGDYMGIINTENGCSDTVRATIEGVVLSLTTSVDDALCGGNTGDTNVPITGNAFVTATGSSTNQYTYQWNDPLNQTTDTAFALTPGEYIVTVTDIATQCTKMDTILINSPSPLVVAVSDVQGETCKGTSDGSVIFDIAGGLPNYDIDWGDEFVRTEPGRNDLSSGDYTVTISDANGCSQAVDFSITAPDSIELSFTSTIINCDNPTGSATVTATGGTGNFSYQWNDLNQQTTPTATGLNEFTFYVVVTDDISGCAITDSVTIEKELPFSIESSSTPSFCANDATGTASVEVTGGSGNFRYLWDDENAQETPTATNLLAGDYMILVIDIDQGCEESLQVSVLEESNAIQVSFETQSISCGGETDGSAEAIVLGGAPGYLYNWSTGSTTRAINDLPVGDYFITITDQNGCVSFDTVNIVEPDTLTGTVMGTDISCEGERDGFIGIELSGGSGNYEYTIDGNRYSTANQFPDLKAGTYVINARDDRGCSIDLGEVQLIEPGAIGVSLEAEYIISAGTPTTLQPEVANGQGTIAYAWTSDKDSTSLSCMDCEQPDILPASGQTYFLTITDEQGCSAETSHQVLVRQNRAVFVPTGFSPNADGHNDLLTVHGQADTRVMSFKVFDRWGELVFEQYDFETNDFAVGWDGTYRGQVMNASVFTWIAEVAYSDGVQEVLKGHTTLIK